MGLKKGIYIMDCVPKNENRNEGKALYETLNLYRRLKDKLRAKYNYVKSKNEFIKNLDDFKEERYQFLHIACHGDIENRKRYIELPNGQIYPKDLDCIESLRGRICTISGCELGKDNFIKPFKNNTKLDVVIAPRKIILYIEGITFLTVFYYNIIALKRDIKISFNNAKSSIKNECDIRYYSD